jgi:hypothetical protein
MSEDGFVPTPRPVTDLAVAKLLSPSAPCSEDRLLLPGCGTGNFFAAILRYCSYRGHPVPNTVAIEKDQSRVTEFADRFENRDEPFRPEIPQCSKRQLKVSYPPDWTPANDTVNPSLDIRCDDFLLNPPSGPFDYIIANPPFVAYNDLDKKKRERYSERFTTTEGSFNLYMPFIEQMCNLLADDGRLIFICPDEYLTSNRGATLRSRLREETIHHVWPLPEPTFDAMVRTSMTDISGDSSLSRDGSFCITSWYYFCELKQILESLGVEEAQIDDAVESYLNRKEEIEERLRGSRRWNGADGGYNTSVDPHIKSDKEETQGTLTEWTGA